MKKVLFSTVLIFMASTLFATEGKVIIHYKGHDATLYVDGKKNISLTQKVTSLMLEEGDHILKVVQAINEEYEKYGEKKIYISPSGSCHVTLKFKKRLEPTENYRKVLKQKDKIKLQRFYRSESKTVIDRKLGLMWQDDEYHRNKKRGLTEAKKYCQKLKFAKFNDWRLPTYEELLTIVDYDRYDSAIIPLFKKTFPKRYWSLSQDVAAPNYAWVIDFEHGKTSSSKKSNRHYVRCLRDK